MRNLVHEYMLARRPRAGGGRGYPPGLLHKTLFPIEIPWARRRDSGRIAAMQNEGPPAGSEAVPEGAEPQPPAPDQPREIGGPPGPEPTRFGDWEKAGRCIDF